MPTQRFISKKFLAMLFIVIIAVNAASIFYVAFHEKRKGIEIVFKDSNNKHLMTSAVGSPETLRKVDVEVQVEAILPTGPNATETIFLGFLNNSKLCLNAENPEFKKFSKHG